MTLLFIPRAGCASKPRLPRRTGRPPGALPPASVLLIMGAGAGAEVALRARPLPAWQPLLGQLHGEAASESLGTLTPGPCCDPAYPTPPPPPRTPPPLALRTGREVSAPARDATLWSSWGRGRRRPLGCGASAGRNASRTSSLAVPSFCDDSRVTFWNPIDLAVSRSWRGPLNAWDRHHALLTLYTVPEFY